MDTNEGTPMNPPTNEATPNPAPSSTVSPSTVKIGGFIIQVLTKSPESVESDADFDRLRNGDVECSSGEDAFEGHEAGQVELVQKQEPKTKRRRRNSRLKSANGDASDENAEEHVEDHDGEASGKNKKKAKGGTGSKMLTQIPKARTTTAEWNGQTCVPSCRGPRKHNPCPIRNRRINGNLSCVEVHDLIRKMGIPNPEKTSACVRAGILRHSIKVTGSPEDLDIVMYREMAPCGPGHYFEATLEDVLLQPDCPGNDLRKGRKLMTIQCKICYAEEGSGVDDPGPLSRAYVSGMCTGRPYFNNGRYDTHCKLCSGFGGCTYDPYEKRCHVCGYCYGPEIFPAD